MPPAAGSWEVAVPAAKKAAAQWSSASWGQFWVELPPPHLSPVGHIWKSGQPAGRGRKNDTVTADHEKQEHQHKT